MTATSTQRDSFIFYRSFYEAINELPDEDQLQIYRAIASYSLNAIKPEGLSPIGKAIWALISPLIDANRKRYINGSKAKRKQDISEDEANEKQNGSKEEANLGQEKSKPQAKPKQTTSKVEANKDKDVNNNENENINIYPESSSGRDSLKDFEEVWGAYHRKGSKKDAREIWKKLSPKEKSDCKESIPLFLKENPERRYRKDFERYLKSKIWESVLDRQEAKNKIEHNLAQPDAKTVLKIEGGAPMPEHLRNTTPKSPPPEDSPAPPPDTRSLDERMDEAIKAGHISPEAAQRFKAMQGESSHIRINTPLSKPLNTPLQEAKSA